MKRRSRRLSWYTVGVAKGDGEEGRAADDDTDASDAEDGDAEDGDVEVEDAVGLDG